MSVNSHRNDAHTPSLMLDWGIEGMRYALRNHNIIVVVDTLRFSTAVVTAVAHGFTIHPVADRKSGEVLASSIGANLAGKPGESKYTISPHSYLESAHEDNREVVLFSPNGANCSALAGRDNVAYVGCLLNAKTIGGYITAIARSMNTNVTIIAAGEQRAVDTGERIVYEKRAAYPVFAIEDYLGSGAIICYSDLQKSAEAQVCQWAFERSTKMLIELMLDSFSGRYLVQNNLREDVEHAARLNLYDVIPIIKDGKISNLRY